MGGFGIYVAGHSEDLIIDTVKAQLSRQGLHSQELIDPLRGYLAKAMADCTPGDLQQCFFTNCGTEAVEIAMKLARFKSKGKWFISTTHAFHGKTGGSGQRDLSPALSPSASAGAARGVRQRCRHPHCH